MREKDMQRKRQAVAAKLSDVATAAAEQASLEQQQQYWAERLEEEYWSSLSTRYYATRCCGFRMERCSSEYRLFRRFIGRDMLGMWACLGCGDMISSWNFISC